MSTLPAVKRIIIFDLFSINNSLFNIILSLLIYFSIRGIPQAAHIVFDQFDFSDLILPSILICIYTLLVTAIFFSNDDEVTTSRFRCLTIYGKLNRLFLVSPFLVWGITLLFNSSLSSNPFHTCILGIVFLVLVGLLPLSFIIKNKVKIEGKINAQADQIIIFIFLVVTTILFRTYIYFNDFNFKIANRYLAFLLSVLFIVLYWFIYKIDFKGFSWKWIRNNIFYVIGVLSGLSIIICIQIGLKITSFSIILFYFILIRCIMYSFGELIMIVYYQYKVNVINRTLKFVKLIFGFISGIMLLLIIVSLIFQEIYSRTHLDFKSNYSALHVKDIREILSSNFKDVKDSLNPVYLVAGQGGGSRAGAAFFTTMCLLDSLIGKNVIAMTTVSGSSNGAGFYLSAKGLADSNNTSISSLINKENIRSVDSILYHKDYISSSLYKLLITDYGRTLFGSTEFERSRNYALMAEEKKAFDELNNFFRLDSFSILNKNFTGIFSGNKRPLFFPNTFNIEKGLKAIASPVILPKDKMTKYYDILDELKGNDISLSQAINLSQQFPFISASASLNGYHYLDGGVYDNLGYETLFDLYKVVKLVRDSLNSKRPIILLSLVNSDYEAEESPNDIKLEMQATKTAVIQSLFSSNPKIHKFNGIKTLDSVDNFFELKLFKMNSKAEKSMKFLKYTPDNEKVLLSRYLSMQNIDTIIACVNSEMEKLKLHIRLHLDSVKIWRERNNSSKEFFYKMNH